MITSAILGRLQLKLTTVNHVGSLFSAATLEEALAYKVAQPPAVFVIAPSLVAERNEMSAGAIWQRVKHTYLVGIQARNLKDGHGQSVLAEIEAIHSDARAALHGWTPDNTLYDPLEYSQGSCHNNPAYEGVWLWADQYTTQSYIRSTAHEI